jgi:histidine triad (HIT) family protein
MSSECVFCKIMAGEIPAVSLHEDDTAIIFLDIDQATQGHTLIIPRRHAADFHELDGDTAAHMGRLAQEWAGRIMRAVGADGYNLVLNNRRAAGQEVMHAHLHIMPRRTGDHYIKAPSSRRVADGEELQALATLIRDAK